MDPIDFIDLTEDENEPSSDVELEQANSISGMEVDEFPGFSMNIPLQAHSSDQDTENSSSEAEFNEDDIRSLVYDVVEGFAALSSDDSGSDLSPSLEVGTDEEESDADDSMASLDSHEEQPPVHQLAIFMEDAMASENAGIGANDDVDDDDDSLNNLFLWDNDGDSLVVQPNVHQNQNNEMLMVPSIPTDNHVCNRCPICTESVNNRTPVSTCCGHVFCKECLQSSFVPMTPKRCPLCRNILNNDYPFQLVYLT